MNLEKRIKKSLERTKKDIIHEEELKLIEIIECDDPLISIKENTDFLIKMKPIRLEYAGENDLYARKTIIEMLKQAKNHLPKNLNFIIFDAYRPIKYQQMRFNTILNKIKSDNPDLTYYEARKEAFIYVFPPSNNPKTPPPHSTGGAIDLGLIDQQGNELDMGCEYGIFNDTTYTNNMLINVKQKENRKLLLTTMIKSGFTNYPGEWWHFSYGDREWAAYENKEKAIFGRADLLNKK